MTTSASTFSRSRGFRSGQLKTVTSPDGVTCTYAYDGPLLASESWSGAVAGSVARTYDNAFRDSTEIVTVGLASSEVSFGYDGDGLLTRAAAVPAGWVFDIHRADSTGLVDSTQVSGGAGRVTSSAGYNAHGELAELHYSLAGSALFHQSIERNVLGQITRITEPPRVLRITHRLSSSGERRRAGPHHGLRHPYSPPARRFAAYSARIAASASGWSFATIRPAPVRRRGTATVVSS